MKTNKIDVRTRPTDLKVRDTQDGAMKISGYAIVFNEISQDMGFYEYVLPSALNGVDVSDLLLLYNHDYSNILARTSSDNLQIKVDKKGLFFSATLADTTLAKDVYNDILAGNLKGCSFGFTIAEGGDSWKRDKDGNAIHYISQIDTLSELSLTAVPAYTATSLQVQRSLDKIKKGESNLAQDEQQPSTDLVALVNKLVEALAQSKPETKAQAKDDKDKEAEKPADDKESTPATPDEAPADKEPEGIAPEGDKPVDGAPEVKEPEADPEKDKDEKDRDKKQAQVGQVVVPITPAKKKKQRDEEDAEADVQPDTSEAVGGEVPSDGDVQPDTSEDEQRNLKGNEKMATELTNKKDEQKRSFEEFLKTGSNQRAADSHIALQDGSVLIPETILPAEHEEHQFPRLGSLVRNISVKTTTGKLPVFYTSDDVLAPHSEFEASDRHAVPEIKPIPWDLKSYSSTYAYSQELLDDSQYDWELELQSRLQELKDNTDDQMVITALTKDVEKVAVTDGAGLVDSIKKALDMNLKPQDSQKASIVVSQSAFYALHAMQDKEGRDLVQPDMTNGASQKLLGKTLIVVSDELFPEATAGDINAVVAPMDKAVIKFFNQNITGKFMDTYDVFYRLLGIYERLDVVQARKDLITFIGVVADPKA